MKTLFDYNPLSKDIGHSYNYLKQSGITYKQAQYIIAYLGSIDKMNKMSQKGLFNWLLKIPTIGIISANKVVKLVK